ncbi:MAG TPA: glycosyltransferase family 2 protein [Actinomycetota bacterium]|nr:glycosyltransferase family 2 protein [Actinomycetota bacterium]
MELNELEVGPRVLAVVVTHNGSPWLEECLTQLSLQVYPAMDVVVVDSGSRESALSTVQRLLPDAEFVRLERNVGFGAAANRALEVSPKAPDAGYFLFLHDDVALDPEVTSLLMAAAIETEAGIVGGKGTEWDNPEVLVEVGMSADQFGYPFSGLEEGEIDQGQHDVRRETLYVSSACMLVSRPFIERSGLWDGGYFAFGEDLDLCTRARLSGFKVMVQPAAQFRHAVALATQNRESPAAGAIRFLTRRNRPRTIAKNVALYRMFAILLIYSILAVSEMVVLAFFRRWDELPAYPRALGSFITSVPDIIKRRRAVQKRRAVPDRRIRRFMVRDIHRARVFFERRIRDWERGTLEFGVQTFSKLSPSRLKSTFGTWVKRPSTLASVAVVVLIAFGLRQVLFGEALAGGSLWPFPDPVARLFTDYFAAWRDIRLGSESAAPAAFPILWLFGLLSFGNPITAQKLMVVCLFGVGLLGISRFVSLRGGSGAARPAAMLAYGLNPLVRQMVTTGDLGAMAMYAGFPFLLEIWLRILGPVPGQGAERPSVPLTADAMGRTVLRCGLIAAPIIALAPSAAVSLVWVVLVLSTHAFFTSWERKAAVRRGLWALSSIPIALLLLVPWSLEALRPRGAILGPLFSDPRSGTYSALWRSWDLVEALYLNHGASLAAGLVFAVVGLGALVMTTPSRRRESKMLTTMWLASGLLGGAITKTLLPAPTSSPALWSVASLTCLACLAGHLVAGSSEELPMHSFGWRHLAAPITALTAIAGVLLGWMPILPNWDRPAGTFAAGTTELSQSISSYLVATSDQVGDFRVLWLGDKWVDPIRSGSRRMDGTSFFITDPGGLTMLDAQEPSPSEGERRLDDAVDALVGRRLHLAGHLLAPASIRFIIVDPTDDFLMAALRRQRDIAQEQQIGTIAIFRNLRWLPRAALAPVNLVKPVTEGSQDDRALMLADWSGGRPIPQRSRANFRGDLPRTRHSQLLLAENYNSAWKAKVGDQRLKHSKAFGWANRFDLPPTAKGEVRVSFTRRWVRFLWVGFQIFIVAIAIAASRPGKHEIKGWLS